MARFADGGARCGSGRWPFRLYSEQAIQQRDVSSRLASIGEINIRLLRLIARQAGHAIDHSVLVELEQVSPEAEDAPLFRLTAEERVYRVLFLVSAGLLAEVPGSDAAPRYIVLDEIIAAIGASPNLVAAKAPRRRS